MMTKKQPKCPGCGQEVEMLFNEDVPELQCPLCNYSILLTIEPTDEEKREERKILSDLISLGY
jgi:DNA-directed RNA polymerase subunit RPC12/RpoP